MKILLIQPCFRFPAIQHYQLGLFQLAGSLREAGHEVEYLPAFQKAEYFNVNPAFDVVGIYTIDCMVPYISGLVEKLRHNHHICLGGPTATIAPEYCTENVYYDSLCRGEGDIALVEMLDRFGTDKMKSTESFWFDCGKIRNPIRPQMSQDEMRNLPPEARQYMEQIVRRYCTGGQFGCTHVIASRGCPFSCTYCSNAAYNQTLRHGVRYKHPSRVIEEVESYKVDGGIVVFEDDVLNADGSWFESMMAQWREYATPRNIRFEMNTRADVMTQEQVSSAANAGCYTVRFGVESGSQKTRRAMGRQSVTNEHMLMLAQRVLDASMNLYICSIIGTPGETPSDFDETRAVVSEIYEMACRSKAKCTVILNSYYPLHGTPLGDACYRNGWVARDVHGIGAHVDYPLQTEWMTREYVLKQQQRWRKDFASMIPMEPAINE